MVSTHTAFLRRQLPGPIRRGFKRLKLFGEGLKSERKAWREIETLPVDNAVGTLPHFLIIGAPKCGTSWLAGALRRHPRVFMVPDEIEYFSSHLDRPLSWYQDHFHPADDVISAIGEAAIIGEKSAGYCALSLTRIKLVHRLLPTARLILMIRDPVARHWSHAKRFFSKEKAKRRGYRSLTSDEQLRRFFVRTRPFSEFSRMIENWTAIYPAEQLLILSQENAIARPGETFEKAMHHIGASEDVGHRVLKHALRRDRNRGPAIPIPSYIREYLERMFSGERLRLHRILCQRFPAEMTRELNVLNT
jgi:hypothetical protein